MAGYSKAVVVAELASRLGNNKTDLLTDPFDQFNNILTSNKKEVTKSFYSAVCNKRWVAVCRPFL